MTDKKQMKENKTNKLQKEVLELRKLSIQEQNKNNTEKTLNHMIQFLCAFEAEVEDIKPNKIRNRKTRQ